jgi:hypothetical protein
VRRAVALPSAQCRIRGCTTRMRTGAGQHRHSVLLSSGRHRGSVPYAGRPDLIGLTASWYGSTFAPAGASSTPTAIMIAAMAAAARRVAQARCTCRIHRMTSRGSEQSADLCVCRMDFDARTTTLSLEVSDDEAAHAREWADRLGIERPQLLRDALRSYLLALAAATD